LSAGDASVVGAIQCVGGSKEGDEEEGGATERGLEGGDGGGVEDWGLLAVEAAEERDDGSVIRCPRRGGLADDGLALDVMRGFVDCDAQIVGERSGFEEIPVVCGEEACEGGGLRAKGIEKVTGEATHVFGM
jgi:hypothetical protein